MNANEERSGRKVVAEALSVFQEDFETQAAKLLELARTGKLRPGDVRKAIEDALDERRS